MGTGVRVMATRRKQPAQVLPEVLGLLEQLRMVGATKVELHEGGGVKAIEFAPGVPESPPNDSEGREERPTAFELALQQASTRSFQGKPGAS